MKLSAKEIILAVTNGISYGLQKSSSNNSIALGRLDGNSRGSNAIDIQTSRTASSQVASSASSIAIGISNTASNTNTTIIGQSNSSSKLNSLILGASNTVQSTGPTNSTLIGFGNSASSYYNDSYTNILIGNSNNSASSYYNNVLVGSSNYCGQQTCYSSIFGYYNYANGGQTNILIGNGNASSNSQNILLGISNSSSSTTCGIFGNANSTNASLSYCIGYNNSTNGQFSMALGFGGKTTNNNQFAFSTMYISSAGDAQASKYIAKGSTSNGTATELYTHNSGRISLPNDTTYTFQILVVARNTNTDTESAGYRLAGVIRRGASAATTTLVGSVEKTVLGEDVSAWDVDVTADSTNGSLKITVTGEAGKTIRWVACVDIAQVTG